MLTEQLGFVLPNFLQRLVGFGQQLGLDERFQVAHFHLLLGLVAGLSAVRRLFSRLLHGVGRLWNTTPSSVAQTSRAGSKDAPASSDTSLISGTSMKSLFSCFLPSELWYTEISIFGIGNELLLRLGCC